MSKTVGKFINLSEEWELNYCLKKYGFSETQKNRDALIVLIKDKIKPYFDLKSSDNLEWAQIDTYHKDVGIKL